MSLLEAADEIGRLQDRSRWMPAPGVAIEHELRLAMFCVRCLIEQQKLSESLTSTPIDVIVFPKRTGQQVTLLNRHEIKAMYDFEHKQNGNLKLEFLCNQVIHSYVIFVESKETPAAAQLFVCSDHERNKCLYVVSVSRIMELLRAVGFDSANTTIVEWNQKRRDYRTIQVNTPLN
jgi:hypothetical protein